MERNAGIPFDLEGTPLQIKTDTITGSGEKTSVDTYTADESYVGGVHINFASPIKYYISSCTSAWTNLPVQPTDEVEKTWTIRKTATALIIECNGVEVLNYQFSESSDNECELAWGTHEVKGIKFSKNYDDASVSYRAISTGILMGG